jgi:putative peptidoglycan lipid II flippase
LSADEPPPAPPAPRLGATAALLAASVLLSRALGLVRDMVLSARVGAGPEADAYNAAFQLPDLLNYFLAGGALSIAFVPLWTRTRARDGEEAAARLFRTVLGTLGVVVAVASGVLWLAADALVALQFPRFDPAQRALTAQLTRIVLPAQLFFVCGGVVQAALMAQGRFAAQAAAPLVYNVGIILGGFLLAPTLGVAGFAWGALLGAAVGALVLPLLDARGRLPLGLRVAPFDRAFVGYLAVAAPLMAGVTLLTVDEWYDRWFGQLGGEGTIASLAYARRLMQVPVAVIGQALATAALPTLARLWSEGRREELDGLVRRTLEAGLGLGVLGAAATWALAPPLVTLVYQRGAFGPDDAARVAATLEVFAFAVPAWIAQQIAVRPFYARGDTWRPMLLGTVLAAAALPLYRALAGYGAPGLAAAGALGVGASALATLVLARASHGAPRLGSVALAALRAAAVGVAVGLVARAVQPGAGGPWGALVDLACGGAAFAAAASAAAFLASGAATRDAALRIVRAALRRPRGSETPAR